jgi:hypothetical protein
MEEEAEMPEMHDVFPIQTVQIDARSVGDLLAKVVRWQYENTTLIPIHTKYNVYNEWHGATVYFFDPYPSEEG